MICVIPLLSTYIIIHPQSGIRVSERLLPNGSLGWNNHYIPREDPFNESSAPDPVIMDGCTGKQLILSTQVVFSFMRITYVLDSAAGMSTRK